MRKLREEGKKWAVRSTAPENVTTSYNPTLQEAKPPKICIEILTGSFIKDSAKLFLCEFLKSNENSWWNNFHTF